MISPSLERLIIAAATVAALVASMAATSAAQNASYARISKLYTNYDGMYQAVELELVPVGTTPLLLGGRTLVVRALDGRERTQVLPATYDGPITHPFLLLSSWAGDGSIFDTEGGDVRLAPDMIPVGGGTIELEGMDTWSFGPLPRTGAHALARTGEVVPSILNVHTNQFGIDGRYEWVAEYPQATLVEYYHAGMNDYFVTAEPEERLLLDSGRIAGWKPTTRRSTAYVRPASASPTPGTVPVCRFLRLHDGGYTHFHSAEPRECAALAADPSWILEAAVAFHVIGADPDSGTCPSSVDFEFPLHGETRKFENPSAVYRLWNGQSNALHRHVKSKALRDTLTLQGWRPEGYGPDGVAWCGWGS